MEPIVRLEQCEDLLEELGVVTRKIRELVGNGVMSPICFEAMFYNEFYINPMHSACVSNMDCQCPCHEHDEEYLSHNMTNSGISTAEFWDVLEGGRNE